MLNNSDMQNTEHNVEVKSTKQTWIKQQESHY